MMNEQPINLEPLIRLLARMSEGQTKAEQLATLERALVSVELDPCPLDYLDLTDALEALAGVDLAAREWQETGHELNAFFAA